MPRVKKEEGAAIKWKCEGSYSISFTLDAFAEENPMLADLLKGISGGKMPRVMLAADANVVHRIEGIGTKIGRYVQKHGIELVGTPIVIGGGEKIKSDGYQTVARVTSTLLDARLGAEDVVLILGGGTVFDVIGWAAAQVRGGLRVVRIPTTVAGMIDAAYSETANLDFGGKKDALKVPCRPSAVLVDPSFATTVLDAVWRGGLGEAVRLAATSDAALLKWIVKNVDALKSRDLNVYAELLQKAIAVRVKKGGNGFGLWLAERLETMSGFKLPHGYAVAIGVCVDSAYAVARGFMKDADREAVGGLLATLGSLDGMGHSRHLLRMEEQVLAGLDAWRASHAGGAIDLPGAIGKLVVEESPDRAVYAEVFKGFLSETKEKEEA